MRIIQSTTVDCLPTLHDVPCDDRGRVVNISLLRDKTDVGLLNRGTMGSHLLYIFARSLLDNRSAIARRFASDDVPEAAVNSDDQCYEQTPFRLHRSTRAVRRAD